MSRRARPTALIWAGLAGAALVLAGCSAAPAADSRPSAEETSPELSGTLNIAAAASLQPAFEELTEAFTELHPGVTIDQLTFDGSSGIATQILAGAPIDVFASADEANMEKVVAAELTTAPPIAFATSSLQIAVAPENPLGITKLTDLTDPALGADGPPVVVTCAPEVPCGAASWQLLDRDGVKLVPASEEQNVTAVLTKVAAGEADAGLIYRSDVLRSDGAVEGVDINRAEDAAGTYVIAPIADTAALDAASAFTEFMRSERAQELFAQLGFGPA